MNLEDVTVDERDRKSLCRCKLENSRHPRDGEITRCSFRVERSHRRFLMPIALTPRGSSDLRSGCAALRMQERIVCLSPGSTPDTIASCKGRGSPAQHSLHIQLSAARAELEKIGVAIVVWIGYYVALLWNGAANW